MHDIPYLHTNDVGPEIVACMSVICHKIKNIFQRGPVGVQLLAGANKQALAVGQAAGMKRLDLLLQQSSTITNPQSHHPLPPPPQPTFQQVNHSIKINQSFSQSVNQHSITQPVSHLITINHSFSRSTFT